MKHSIVKSPKSPLVDRGAHAPAYQQLVQIIRRQISVGEFPPGSRLPSETQLCATHKVSPMTVRRAVNLLLDQGVVVTTQGKGTFVKPLDILSSSFNLAPLRDLIGDPAHTDVRLLRVELLRADEAMAARLSLAPGKRIIGLSRVIRRDRQPVMLHRAYMAYDPTAPVVESEMEVTKLMGIFDGRGKTAFKKGEIRLVSVVLCDEDAALLQLPAGSAGVRLEHTFFDFHDRKMSWGWFLGGSERLQFVTNVGIWE